jgi:hypothetical protein
VCCRGEKLNAGISYSMKRLKFKTIENILYVAGDGKENLLIKVRGRGWFLSSGGNDLPGLSTTRLKAWLRDDEDSFQRVVVQHFHVEPPKPRKK